MKFPYKLVATILLLSCALLSAEDRKVKKQVPPAYPEIARRANIRGTVKIEIVIAKNGSVKSTKVVGGHPLLTDAAEKAVRQWVYESAEEETTKLIVLNFEP